MNSIYEHTVNMGFLPVNELDSGGKGRRRGLSGSHESRYPFCHTLHLLGLARIGKACFPHSAGSGAGWNF